MPMPMQKYCWPDRSANVSDTPTPTWEQKLPMSMAGTAESGEGAEVADGEEAVGAPAVVLQPYENFCMGLHISSPNLRLCPPPSWILLVLEEIGSPIGHAQLQYFILVQLSATNHVRHNIIKRGWWPASADITSL